MLYSLRYCSTLELHIQNNKSFRNGITERRRRKKKKKGKKKKKKKKKRKKKKKEYDIQKAETALSSPVSPVHYIIQ